MKQRTISLLGASGALILSGLLLSRAQEEPPRVEEPGQAVVEHSDCSFFANRDKLNKNGSGNSQGQALSEITQQVTKQRSSVSGARGAQSFADPSKFGTIDKYLFLDMQENGVAPADKTNDFEFIRRVTLDLTGRIPTPERVLSFTADTATDKRARLVDELLAKPEWVDKWTMYFGDLYNNTDRNTFVNRYEPGRNAFYKWIKTSLADNKPYNKIATELISSQGTNSWVQGELNWVVGSWVINTPQQDNIDQEAADVAETFLGISHMNCVLCHNGRGHLDALSLWGSTMPRTQAWGFASFMSHASTTRTRIDSVNNQYYWSVFDNNPRIQDYALNTTTGNRPARSPIGGQTTMAPVYPFTGEKPKSGENYRVALARIVTSDIQFSRATVNYLWKEFFGRGIVEPANQFDPARLDPDNPPADPWTLQPSNARLLNALAKEFVDDGFNLKTLMQKFTMSEAYQLSSRYDGEWKADYEKLFARKLVRRLWGEEIHDAVVQSTGMMPNNGNGYTLNNFSVIPAGSAYTGYPAFGPIMWAMQSPDVRATPDNNGAVSRFLDAFMRGNRDDAGRRVDGSVLQALNLMNDALITSRVNGATAPRTSLLGRNLLSVPEDQMINNFYLAVLSRYPSADEMKTAVLTFKNADNRTAAENILWSLFNKVDFVFNY
jgi:hypothetical protein